MSKEPSPTSSSYIRRAVSADCAGGGGSGLGAALVALAGAAADVAATAGSAVDGASEAQPGRVASARVRQARVVAW